MESKEKKLDEKPVVLARTATDIQRMKLEKLMKSPDRPAHIPDKPKEWAPPPPPEFVRNAWGSSAGAGSGEFHVYRGVRRREFARQKYLDIKTEKEKKNDEYHNKLEENKKLAEERTAKKRAKRLKKKQKEKNKKQKTDVNESKVSESEEEEDEESENKEDDAEESSFVIGGK